MARLLGWKAGKSMEAGTCLRCGKPYEPEDTVCYSCGAPIGETKTPTQPIRTMRPLPAATPSQPQAVAPVPERPQSRPLAVGALPPRPPAKVATGNKRLWLGLAAVVLVLVAAGAGFYVERGLTAAPPISRQSTYQDPQHRFAFQKPTLWTALTTANGVQLSDSDGSSTAAITVIQTGTPETVADYAAAQATEMGLAPAPAQEIGSELWDQYSGKVTDPTDGAVHEVVLFVTVHNTLIYSITLSCPIASYAQLNTLVYQPLLASFRFED
jgi:hypothetical protein